MIVSLIAIVLIAGSIRAADDFTPYTGVKMTIKFDRLKEMYSSVFDYSAQVVKKMTWPNYEKIWGSSFFSLSFSLTNIKSTDTKYDPSKLKTSLITMKPEVLTLNRTGPALSFTFTFDYDFKLFGMSLYFGAGSLVLSSNEQDLMNVFETSGVKTYNRFSWTPAFEIKGSNPFGAIAKLSEILFSDSFYTLVADAMKNTIHSVVSGMLAEWYTLKTPFYPDGSLNMTLVNSLITAREAPTGFATMAFATNVTIEDRPYNKMIWKAFNPVADLGDNTFQVCFSSSLITAMVEVQGKARDFIFSVKPEQIGLKPTISELIYAMPTIETQLDPSLEMSIGCRPNGNYDIVMLEDAKLTDNDISIQIPALCAFGAKSIGKDIVTINFFLRGKIVKKPELKDNIYSFKGIVSEAKLYSMKIADSAFPVDQPEVLLDYMTRIGPLLENFPILPQGLTVRPPFGNSSPNAPLLSKDNVCFRYK